LEYLVQDCQHEARTRNLSSLPNSHKIQWIIVGSTLTVKKVPIS